MQKNWRTGIPEQMKLILDFGNTLLKIALFEKKDLINIWFQEKLHPNKHTNFIIDFIAKLPEKQKPDSIIISSVVDIPVSLSEYLNKNFTFIELSSNIPIPLTNKYKTPKSLGNDRLAAVVGAGNLYPGKNILVIEAGTCITFDFLNSKNEYLGGAISPGIEMRFKSLNNFTDKLPLVSKRECNNLIGQTTEESILSGILNGVIAEIDGIINSYLRNYENLTVILSGGDIKHFDKRLKNNIFAVPNLVLVGLNVILDYNDKQ